MATHIHMEIQDICRQLEHDMFLTKDRRAEMEQRLKELVELQKRVKHAKD